MIAAVNGYAIGIGCIVGAGIFVITGTAAAQHAGPAVLISFLIAFFPIMVSTMVGLEAIEADMVRLFRSMGAGAYRTFMKLRLPAALPNIFAGLKIGMSLAVVGAVVAEFVAADCFDWVPTINYPIDLLYMDASFELACDSSGVAAGNPAWFSRRSPFL